MKKVKMPVEVYSRVVGYFRPVNHWNKGKQEEFKERKTYKLKKEEKPQVNITKALEVMRFPGR